MWYTIQNTAPNLFAPACYFSCTFPLQNSQWRYCGIFVYESVTLKYVRDTCIAFYLLLYNDSSHGSTLWHSFSPQIIHIFNGQDRRGMTADALQKQSALKKENAFVIHSRKNIASEPPTASTKAKVLWGFPLLALQSQTGMVDLFLCLSIKSIWHPAYCSGSSLLLATSG